MIRSSRYLQIMREDGPPENVAEVGAFFSEAEVEKALGILRLAMG